jgi:flagellar hook-length control protein FliK
LNVQQNGWADTMVRRLQTDLKNGTGAVKIILEPARLGRLQVTMGLKDGRASIRIAADTAQAATLLQESRPQLAQMFDQAGLRLASMQTATSAIGGDAGFGGDGSDGKGANTTSDEQTSGHNANKDVRNSEHGNKLSNGMGDGAEAAVESDAGLAPGETAVLNVLA